MSEWQKLIPHPANPPTYVDQLWGAVERRGTDEVTVRFRLHGDLNMLHLSAIKLPSDRQRRDELWKTTCLELFVRPQGDEPYCEINVATSGDWASYGFEHYRAGMTDIAAEPVAFRAKGFAGGCEIATSILLPHLAGFGTCSAGLSAVIEAIDGTKSYWALAHPDGAPDFHHPACFAATLPAPRTP